MNLKRFVLVVLPVLLAVSLTGCTSQEDIDTSSDSSYTESFNTSINWLTPEQRALASGYTLGYDAGYRDGLEARNKSNVLPSLSLDITYVTSLVGPGYSATLTAKTVPYAICTITVYYKSGPSTAQGLYTKTADSSGNVSWTWKVGTRTTAGSWRIVVTASSGGETVSDDTYFTVR